MAQTDFADSVIVPDTTTGGTAADTLNKIGYDTQQSIKLVTNGQHETEANVNFVQDQSAIIVANSGRVIEKSWSVVDQVWYHTENILPNTFISRKGSDSNWSAPGNTDISLAFLNTTKIQIGSVFGSHAGVTPIFFSHPFSQAPLVFLQIYSFNQAGVEYGAPQVTYTTPTSFTFNWSWTAPNTPTPNPIIFWLAVGDIQALDFD